MKLKQNSLIKRNKKITIVIFNEKVCYVKKYYATLYCIK